LELSQRGNVVKALGDIRVIDFTVMLCHLKGRMAEKLLKSKSIPLAIDKEFPSKGMAKGM
jgi:hypothetical protein